MFSGFEFLIEIGTSYTSSYYILKKDTTGPRIKFGEEIKRYDGSLSQQDRPFPPASSRIFQSPRPK